MEALNTAPTTGMREVMSELRRNRRKGMRVQRVRVILPNRRDGNPHGGHGEYLLVALERCANHPEQRHQEGDRARPQDDGDGDAPDPVLKLATFPEGRCLRAGRRDLGFGDSHIRQPSLHHHLRKRPSAAQSGTG